MTRAGSESDPRRGEQPRRPSESGSTMSTSTDLVSSLPTMAFPPDAAAHAADGVIDLELFPTAWCGVGGERGGEVVPRWFPALADLGVAQVHLFWAVPETGHAASALDGLRSASGRWLAELRALGLEGELSIKRGEPAAWLAALADISPGSLIVLGPPARGQPSATLQHLLQHGRQPLLLLPDLVYSPEIPLLARPVIDAGVPRAAGLPGGAALWDTPRTEWLDLAPLEPLPAARTALRRAEDSDASLIVLSRRSTALAPLLVQYGTFPVLVLPAAPPH